MNWIELIIHTTTRGADAVSDLLMELGAAGTQTPFLNPPSYLFPFL